MQNEISKRIKLKYEMAKKMPWKTMAAQPPTIQDVEFHGQSYDHFNMSIYTF